jgi:hypothetical protein
LAQRWANLSNFRSQHYSPYWLYFPSFAVVLTGLIIYFWTATPDEQGKIDPRRPTYVRQVSVAGIDVESGVMDVKEAK